MTQRNNFPSEKLLLLPILLLVLGFLTRAVVELVAHSGTRTEDGPALIERDAPDNLSRIVLTDFVLSLLKKYYVDRDRVKNAYLLESTLHALTQKTDLRVTYRDDVVYLETGETSQALNVPRALGYNQFLNILVTMSQILGEQHYDSSRVAKEDPSIYVMNALLGSLDTYSTILSPDSYRDLREGTEGLFGGVGVLVGIRDNVLTVIKSLPKSPASRTGILTADRILAINGISTYGFALEDLVGYMRGAPGTNVKLSLLREGEYAAQELDVMREVIQVDSIATKTLNAPSGNKVLYMMIESFSMRTYNEVSDAITTFKAENQKNAGLIIDLRSNPGGLLDQAVKVADIFFSSGLIVKTVGRIDEVEEATKSDEDNNDHVVVLINEETASASEILAGALKDNDRAVIIGRSSYGKGSVQTIFELPEGRALKLTIARYYTPSGRSIQDIGVVPDISFQPVFAFNTNRNVFGNFRFRPLGTRPQALHAEKRDLPLLRASYLLREDNIDPDKGNSDLELGAALVLLDSTTSAHSDISLREAALNSTAFKHFLSEKTKQVNTFLREKFGLTWNESAPRSNVKPTLALEVEAKLKGNVLECKPGDEVRIPFVIRNQGLEDVHRISVVLRTPDPNIVFNEQLVGTIPRNSFRQGVLVLDIPTNAPPGKLLANMTVAADAELLEGVTKAFNVRINDRELAILSITSQLVDERGGLIKGELESRERARVFVRIANKGSVDANIDKIDVVNLSGKQIQIGEVVRQIKLLHPYEISDIAIDVKANEPLVSDKLPIGISIESRDLIRPFREVFTISSIPEKKPKVDEYKAKH